VLFLLLWLAEGILDERSQHPGLWLSVITGFWISFLSSRHSEQTSRLVSHDLPEKIKPLPRVAGSPNPPAPSAGRDSVISKWVPAVVAAYLIVLSASFYAGWHDFMKKYATRIYTS